MKTYPSWKNVVLSIITIILWTRVDGGRRLGRKTQFSSAPRQGLLSPKSLPLKGDGVLGNAGQEIPGEDAEFVAGSFILTQRALDEAPYRYSSFLTQVSIWVCHRERFFNSPLNINITSAKLLKLYFTILGLGYAKTVSWPTAAAWTG